MEDAKVIIAINNSVNHNDVKLSNRSRGDKNEISNHVQANVSNSQLNCDKECGICLFDITDVDKMVKLSKCNHYAHSDCLLDSEGYNINKCSKCKDN